MNTSELESVTRIKLRKPNRPTLVWQLTDRGFGSEIHYMLLGALYSLEHDYNFMLYSRTWNASACAGWSDYFLGFCDEVDHIALRYACIFRRPRLHWRMAFAVRKAVLTRVLPVPFCFTNEIFPSVRQPEYKQRRFAAGTAAETDLFGACRRILLEIWKHNAATAQAIARIQAPVMQDETSYCTIHIRRGDKKTETPYVPIEKYIETVQAVNARIERVFVMTDDYAVFEQVKEQYSQFDFVTLCPQDRRGHLQSRFNKHTQAQRKMETLLLLTELEIARKGGFFVGTFSSNLGNMVALLRGKETTHSVDLPEPRL